ncbi:MAG TPA: FAD-dependent oxidoreductase [Chthoniobacteraceae bacterium]|jgi:monoamine oxidase|nr:FAD-dependent oxidoreductase [Chthoniobacteraceae bacterium]
MAKEVTIIGGGLAGMVAALRLRQRGFDVVLYEASHRLGGKAGAETHGHDWDEHGWHLFPLWYLNIWALVKELGIEGSFVDRTRYAYMRAGEYPKNVYLESPFAWRSAWHNLFEGVLPPADGFLYQYVLLDLMSQPVRRRASLDQVTVNGFARSRFYINDRVVDQLEDTVSRASAIESYEMSAMTVRNVMRYWFRYHSPWFRILVGDLQSHFIQPLEAKLRELGCEIRMNSTVTRLVTSKERATDIDIFFDGATRTEAVENLLVAIPPEATRLLATAPVTRDVPSMGGVFYLRSRIMAGMTIYLNRRVTDLPTHHVNFVGTPYELSLVDVTDVWKRGPNSILCIVVSDYTTLQRHSVAEASEILLSELRRYLPFLTSDAIARIDLQPHTGEPLFANTAGAWPYRPKAVSELPNLFFAGDHCQSSIDLTCMEGAVSSGLIAAEAIRSTIGIGEPIKVIEPETRPRILLVLLKFLLLPGALIALAVSSLQHAMRRDT